jgi:hypothetical protein
MSDKRDNEVEIAREKIYYCKKIVETVQNIENVEWLRFIHRMIKNLIE